MLNPMNMSNSRRQQMQMLSRGKSFRNPEVRRLASNLRSEVDGHAFTPARTPPQVSQTPWNQLVVTIKQNSSSTAATPTQITTAQIFVAIRAQLAGALIPDTVLGEMRFSRVEYWNLGNNASASMDVYPLISLSATTTAKMVRLEDQPGKNQWACVGYEWPRAHRNYVFPSSASVPLIVAYSDVASSVQWFRFHVLWRFTTSGPPDYHQQPERLDWAVL